MVSKRLFIDQGASIYRSGASDIWRLDLNLPGRIRQRTSLGTIDRELAVRIARDQVHQAKANLWGVALPRDIEYSEFQKKYLEHAEVRNAPGTVEINTQILKRFGAHLQRQVGAGRKVMMTHITPELIESYIKARKDGGCSPWTVNRDLGGLSVFLNRAVRVGYLRSNAAQRVQRLPVDRNRVPRTLKHDQIQKLLAEAAAPVPCHGRGRKGKGNSRARIKALIDQLGYGAKKLNSLSVVGNGF